MATKIDIGGELNPRTVEGIVADASTIIDRTAEKRQDEINSEVSESLEGKQDVIADLETIRSGAASGSTAIQPTQIEDVVRHVDTGALEPLLDPSDYATTDQLNQLGQEVTEKIGGSITPELAIEQGNITTSGESDSTTRLRTSNYIVADKLSITISGNGKVYVYGYTDDGTYVNRNGWVASSQDVSIQGAVKYRLVFAYSNDNLITPSNFPSLGVSIEAEFDGTFAPKGELTRLSEDVSILEKEDKFVGEGQTFASSSELKLLEGKKYRIYFKNPNWDKSGLAGGDTVLSIRSSYNGVFTTLVTHSKSQTIDSYYDITVPSTSDFITIGGRASVGTIVDFYIFQLELVNERVIAGIEQNELVHTVTTNRGLEIDNTAHTIKVLSNLNVRVNGVVYTLPENTTYDLTSFTTQTEYVKLIVNTDNLSLDLLLHIATTKYPVIAVFQKQYSSNIILGVIGSPIIGKIIIDGVPALVAPVWDDVTFLKSHSLVNQFVGANDTEAHTDIYGLMPSHKYRIYFPVTEWDISGVSITGVYKMFVNSVKNGVTTRLVNVSMSGTVRQYYDIETPSDFDFLRIGGRATSGVAVGFTITDNTTDEESPFDIPQKANDFALLFNGTAGAVESFIFVTDPHWYNRYAIAGINPTYEGNFETLKKIWDKTPTDFVLSGGDWLNAHKQSIAVEDLANIDALMDKAFGAYYPILGNHDNNYQGELDETEDTGANDGALSNQTMINLWFRKWGRLYYSFKGTSSRFFIFDSGIDWDTAMNSYRWGQIAWFANELNNNTDEHIIIGLHIVCNSGSVFTEHIAPLADNILQVAEAFNARTTITMNGVTYDFTNAQGKIHCAICGHTHYDATAVIHNIPVFCTTTALDGAFDLILIDYGAGELKSIRVGAGSNRELNLAQ